MLFSVQLNHSTNNSVEQLKLWIIKRKIDYIVKSRMIIQKDWRIFSEKKVLCWRLQRCLQDIYLSLHGFFCMVPLRKYSSETLKFMMDWLEKYNIFLTIRILYFSMRWIIPVKYSFANVHIYILIATFVHQF